MKTQFYRITCLTDLHMGSGENNFHIIDKAVERDPVTQYPIMNASGVKGALREYFERDGSTAVTRLFGSKVKGSESSTPGSLSIFAGRLLGRPVRASKGDAPYYIVTTSAALREYNTLHSQLCGAVAIQIPNDLSDTVNYYALPDNATAQIGVEGIPVDRKIGNTAFAEALIKLFASGGFPCPGVVILKDADFRDIALPVSARNHLENGISDNLWYEENVPARSSFWFAVRGSENDLRDFDAGLGKGIVQFGGDASIGKGFCHIEKKEG